MQNNNIGIAYKVIFTALFLWLALTPCELTARDISQEKILEEQRSSPASERLSALRTTVVAGPISSAPAADFRILGEKIAPGAIAQLQWIASQNYAGMGLRAPVFVANGHQPGKVLCLTGAVHGDEINGVEIVRRMFNDLAVEQLRGTLLGVPIVNTHGFERSYRYLEDRRDLNRSFPGQPYGSSAARIAHSLFSQIIARCDLLVDIHTGTAGHTHLPQIVADLGSENVAALVAGFGIMPVVASRPPPGSLRSAAADAGIAAVTLEVGESGRLQVAQIEEGIKALTSLMNFLAMTAASAEWRIAESVQTFYKGFFKVRAPNSGMLMTKVQVGDLVASGEILATIVDPVHNLKTVIRAPDGGRVLSMALSQMVVPGYTIFRVGTEELPVNGQTGAVVEPEEAGVDSVANAMVVVAADLQPDVVAR